MLEVEPKLDELKATALLGRLNLMSTTQNEYEGPPEAKPRVNRADMMWALKKEGAYKEVHGGLPLTLPLPLTLTLPLTLAPNPYP